MQIDWLAEVEKQVEVTERAYGKVPLVLADPGLTLDQASKLYRVVTAGAKDMDDFFDLVCESDVDESFINAVESLQSIWGQMTIDVANKVRSLQGLPPIA